MHEHAFKNVLSSFISLYHFFFTKIIRNQEIDLIIYFTKVGSKFIFDGKYEQFFSHQVIHSLYFILKSILNHNNHI